MSDDDDTVDVDIDQDDIDENDEIMDEDELQDLDKADQNDDVDEENYDQNDDIDELDGYGTIMSMRQLEQDKDHMRIYVVPSNSRITSNVIQKYEMVEAIGIRASQIEEGSPVFTDTTGLTNPIQMAKKEFFDRKSPLILERTVEENHNTFTIYVEHFRVREMTFPIVQL